MSSLSSPLHPTAALRLNFAGQRLRGHNFKGQDLTGADFSGADIRGANFTNAILKGANFTGAKAGIQRRWVVGQFVILFLLSLVLNFVAVIINIAVTVAFAVAVAMLLLSSYVTWRVSKEDEKFDLARGIGLISGAIGGTSFRGADLTNADFSQAILKSTNFNHTKQQQTCLTRTCWKDAKKLDRARVGDSILANSAVRQLLTSGNGINQSYIRANLRDANLNGAKLNGANLKWADLSGATLQQTDLQNANLAETLALRTHFTGAFLTGACLEAWNIDSTTCLENVDCQFVYLLEDQQERRPSSGYFAPGEFTKLFQEVLSTIDLIFRNGVDWKAFVAAFQTVQGDNEDTELTIQSIENKGDGVVVVRVNAPPEADKAELHSQFNQQYDAALKMLDAKYQAQLQAKDDQIAVHRQQSADMKEIVSLLANRPVTVEVKAIAESKSMNDSTDKSQNIEVGGDFNITANNAVVNLRDISGTVTNTIQQIPDDGDRSTIKDLLTQLQGAIETETTLDNEDKAEALEQVKVLAEAGKNPQDGALQKAAKTAAKILKGTVAALSPTTALVKAVTELLPLVTKFFGF